MLRKSLSLNVPKRLVSALYVAGDKANENYAILTPFMDFADSLKERNMLMVNLKRRNLPLNLDRLYDQYAIFKNIEMQKCALEQRRVEIADQLRNETDADNTDIGRKLKTEGRFVREDLKALRDASYHLEQTFIDDFLKVPNEIHRETPIDENRIHMVHKDPPKDLATDHKLCKNYIEISTDYAYYLKKEAALFDILFPYHCIETMKKEGFIDFVNPDFVRTIIPEAATVDLTDLYGIREDVPDNKLNLLHLVGGGSLLGFLGFVAKLSLNSSALPINWVTCGRQYKKRSSPERGLLSPTQTNAVEIFSATADSASAEVRFNSLLETTINIYKEVDLHFRVVFPPASNLLPSESIRADIEMFSPSLNSYVQVGNVSNHTDFISKRILFNYRDGKAYKFPHIVGGTLVNTAKLIAITLENNSHQFNLSNTLQALLDNRL